jgi:hypothetical protein
MRAIPLPPGFVGAVAFAKAGVAAQPVPGL